MTGFRHGQWVLFTLAAEIPLSHRLPSGQYVGIWQNERTDTLSGKAIPAHVVPVKADGNNVRLPMEQMPAGCVAMGEVVGTAIVTVPPSALAAVEPLTNRASLPPGRQVAEGFSPKA